MNSSEDGMVASIRTGRLLLRIKSITDICGRKLHTQYYIAEIKR